MSDLLDAGLFVLRLLWALLRGLWAIIVFLGTVWDWLELLWLPFRRREPAQKARVEALSRPNAEAEARIATHLGTDLESPHIFHMTPPPDRPLEDTENDRT